MASALWGGENIPQHPNPNYAHSNYNTEETWAREIHAFPSFLPHNKQHIRKEDGDILEMWNKVIAEMSADGTTAEITKKWFGRDISM